MKMHRTTLLLALVAFGSTTFAHDFWVQPSSFSPGLDELVHARLYVGHTDAPDELARDHERIARFELLRPEGAPKTVVGLDGHKPAGLLRLQEPGSYFIVFESRPKYLELEPDRFEAYLEEEGLASALRERAERNERDTIGRESFSRSCKTILRADGGTSGFDHVIGLRHEITLLTDPAEWEPGRAIELEVRFEGELARDQQVELQHLEDPTILRILRTDSAGRVRFPLRTPGPWLAGSIHMERVPDEARAELGDWESVWATLAFEL